MTEANLIVENALLRDEIRSLRLLVEELRLQLDASNLIHARNAVELPAFVAMMARKVYIEEDPVEIKL